MATQIKLRRGTTVQHATFIGGQGEITVDTSKYTLVIHDATTAGGIALARENGANATGTWPISISGNAQTATTAAAAATVSSGATGVTPTVGDNSTKIATTAFVLANGVFASGTRMTFNQTAAPTGWTKDTTAALNDSIMRIVTGTVGSGGSTAFSTFNGQTATAAYTLTIADIPSHTHNQASNTVLSAGPSPIPSGTVGTGWGNTGGVTAAQGGGGAHSHGISTAIKYNDFIIASKN